MGYYWKQVSYNVFRLIDLSGSGIVKEFGSYRELYNYCICNDIKAQLV